VLTANSIASGQQPRQIPFSCRNVLIVGGGPAGLAAALMLAKRGWTGITVLEKRMAADYCEPDKSFNYLIDGRGQKFTDLLGLTEQLAAIGVSSGEFHLTLVQPNGSRKTIKLPLSNPKGITPYWVSRRAFLQLLHQEIEQNWSDHITVLFNTQCVAVNQVIQNDLATLEVITESEAPVQQRFAPNLLIGCDGIQSIVRSTLHTWDDSDQFALQQFPSPSSGLRYKVLSLPPHFPLDTQGKEQAVSTISYAIRGKFCERQRSLSLGILPIKDPESPRTANLITRPDHQLWQLKTSEAVLSFLQQSFPQLPLQQMVSPEEVDRFATSNGGTFPIPQCCSGLHYLLTHTTDASGRGTTASGILLLGDAVHCFPPDIGQGVNSALEDVFVLNQVLEENEDDLTQSLLRYEAVRSPDVYAVVRLAQVAAPWQYNQAPLRGRLWAIGFVIRLGLSKVLPWISPPAFFLIRNHQLSYQEIWLRNQRTRRILTVLSLIAFTGLLRIVALLLKRQF
jgi:2-polyprenyl-6-methoxyphenol hydroxylase-like FAD-dependent oxidoreductase